MSQDKNMTKPQFYKSLSCLNFPFNNKRYFLSADRKNKTTTKINPIDLNIKDKEDLINLYNKLLSELKDLEEQEKNDYKEKNEAEESLIINNIINNDKSEDLEDIVLFKNIDDMINSNDFEDKNIKSQQFQKDDKSDITYEDCLNLNINLVNKKHMLKFKKMENVIFKLKTKYQKNKKKDKNNKNNKNENEKKENNNKENDKKEYDEKQGFNLVMSKKIQNHNIKKNLWRKWEEEEENRKKKKEAVLNMEIFDIREKGAKYNLRKIEGERQIKLKEIDKKKENLNEFKQEIIKEQKALFNKEKEMDREKAKINEDRQKLVKKEKEINNEIKRLNVLKKTNEEKEKKIKLEMNIINKEKKVIENKNNELNGKMKEYNIKYEELKTNEKIVFETEKNNKKIMEKINQEKMLLQAKMEDLNSLKKEIEKKEEALNEEKMIIEIEKKQIIEDKDFIDDRKKKFDNEIKEKKENLEKEKQEIRKEKEQLSKELEKLENEKQLIKKEKEILNEMKKNNDKTLNDIKRREKKIEDEKKVLNNEKKSLEDEINKIIEIRNKKRLEKIMINTFNNKNSSIYQTEEEKISDICFLGAALKDEIIKEQNHNSNNILNINQEIKNYDENNKIVLPLYLISNWLNNNGCKVVIEKRAKNKQLNNWCLQHVFTKKAIEKKYTIELDLGKENNELLLNTEKCNNFINSLKYDLSKYLDIDKNDIYIMNPRVPNFTFDFYINDLEESKIKEIIKYIKTKKNIISVKNSVLLEGCRLSPDILDPEFDMKPNDWPINPGDRGGLPYYPPYEYIGCALKVRGNYDFGDDTWLGQCNGEGEFAVAYHGVRSNLEAIKAIMDSHFKEGINQNCKDHDDLRHKGKKCGKGVYVTPRIEVAERYTQDFYVFELKKKYRIVFQCRVNPETFRQSSIIPEYWILKGDGQEIRPYRILIREIDCK